MIATPIRALAACLLLLPAVPVGAQTADFLFHRPPATLSVVGGWAMAGEGSQLFAEVRDQLTVSRGDFSAPALMVEVGVRITERLDLALGLEGASTSVRSEMRDWETIDGLAIPQETRFDRTRLMASVKGYLFRRGRRISEYAWVPARWSPYLGGGVGLTWYEFRQAGDFVDPDTQQIFEARLRSTGYGPGAHALAGVELSLSARFILRGEYRHIWAAAPLDPTVYQEFDDLDLSGGRATLGFAVRM